MSMWIMIALAVFAGAMMPIQAGVNSQLAKYLEHPFQAGFVSFLGGLLLMIIICLIVGKNGISLEKLSKIPWYLYCGGFLGAVLVISAIILAPKLGATVLISSAIAGQLACSVLLDHFGWAGFQVHPVSIGRIVGVLCLFSGVILVRVF